MNGNSSGASPICQADLTCWKTVQTDGNQLPVVSFAARGKGQNAGANGKVKPPKSDPPTPDQIPAVRASQAASSSAAETTAITPEMQADADKHRSEQPLLAFSIVERLLSADLSCAPSERTVTCCLVLATPHSHAATCTNKLGRKQLPSALKGDSDHSTRAATLLPATLHTLSGVSLHHTGNMGVQAFQIVPAAVSRKKGGSKIPSLAVRRERGNRLFQKGDLLAARDAYTASVAAAPGAAALANRALMALKLKQWAPAEADASAAIQLDAGAWKAWQRRGAARLQMGTPEKVRREPHPRSSTPPPFPCPIRPPRACVHSRQTALRCCHCGAIAAHDTAHVAGWQRSVCRAAVANRRCPRRQAPPPALQLATHCHPLQGAAGGSVSHNKAIFSCCCANHWQACSSCLPFRAGPPSCACDLTEGNHHRKRPGCIRVIHVCHRVCVQRAIWTPGESGILL